MGDNNCKEVDLFQVSYEASLSILKKVIPYIDENEFVSGRLSEYAQRISCLLVHKDDNDAELARSVCTMCREVCVMLSFCRDLHSQFVNAHLCERLIDTYKSIYDEVKCRGEINAEVATC